MALSFLVAPDTAVSPHLAKPDGQITGCTLSMHPAPVQTEGGLWGPRNVLGALEQFSDFMVDHPAQRHIRLWRNYT